MHPAHAECFNDQKVKKDTSDNIVDLYRLALEDFCKHYNIY